MNRFILIDEKALPIDRMNGAISWLESIGGGTIVSDLKSNLEDTFKTRTPTEFRNLADSLSRRGIRLAWRRGGLPYSGNVVAAFTTRDVIEMLDEREDIDNLLVLGWSPMDYTVWMDRYDPVQMTLVKERQQ